jgi:hypothetical protein
VSDAVGKSGMPASEAREEEEKIIEWTRGESIGSRLALDMSEGAREVETEEVMTARWWWCWCWCWWWCLVVLGCLVDVVVE